MVSEDKRTATDILLSIENKLNILEGRVKNSEGLLKILLGRLNDVLTPQTPTVAVQPSPVQTPRIPESNVINKDNFETRPKTTKFADAAKKFNIDIEDDVEDEIKEIQGIFVAKPQSNVIESDDMVEASVRGSARGQRGPKNKATRSSVSQTLSAGSNPLFLANIEVFDQEGSLINKGRTNTSGRWLMTLGPGDYQVHVLKRFPPDSGKTPIDTMYQISVPLSDGPLELDPLSFEVG